MTTRTYNGQATLITASSLEIPVTARLLATRQGDQLPEWNGELRPDRVEDTYALKPGIGQLRTGEGTVGDLIVTRIERPSGRMEIRGTGPSPF